MRLLLFNKPYGVLTRFSPQEDRPTLADHLQAPDFHPAGRLDHDSEGLLLLTDDGRLQARITDPRHAVEKVYWAQVEGTIDRDALGRLEHGVLLKDGITRPARARALDPAPALWSRDPPIRHSPRREKPSGTAYDRGGGPADLAPRSRPDRPVQRGRVGPGSGPRSDPVGTGSLHCTPAGR